MLQNIRKERKWTPLLELEWSNKKTPNRGVTPCPEEAGPPVVPTADIATHIGSMLEYISQYAPNCL